MSRFLDLVRERVVVYDGATGTNLQELGLDADDFGGHQFEGCVDLLSVTRPDVIADLHESFFRAGSDVVETNSFGAFAVPLGEYGIPERAHEISLASARIAREVADGYGGLVAGSMGPRTHAAPDPIRPRCAVGGPPLWAPPRRRWQGACWRAGWTCSSPRPTPTCWRPRPRSSAPAGPWPPPAATCRSSSRSRWSRPAPCCSAA